MTNSDFLAEVYGPLSEGEYGWICSFAAPPDQGEWAGRFYTASDRQAALVDSAAASNNYFCTAVLSGTNAAGQMARQKSTFTRLAALVVDDVDPDSLLGGFSWSIQTSPGKHQVGILLDRDDPDAADISLVDAVMGALSARGKLGGNDSSGNAAVRYVRLPYGLNTKPRPAGPWTVSLETWAPNVRWSLADAAGAVGVDLDTLRGAVNRGKNTTHTQMGVSGVTGSVAGEALALLSAPLDQRSYHDSIVRMAASLVAGGMYPGAAVEFLYSLMDQVRPQGPAEEVARWSARRAEIPRAVKSAEKFAPEDRAPAQITVNLGGKPAPVPSELEPLDWAELKHAQPRPTTWAVEGWLPHGHVTLLSANGGVGKSNLSLQLAIAIAQGQKFMGVDTKPGRVLVISAEDDESLVHQRVANICNDMGVDIADLAGRLIVYDVTQADCALWRDGHPTERMQWLADLIETHGPSAVILDNASDLFHDNENDRSAVRGFLRCLKMVAAHNLCAVLLLAHVDKASVRVGAGMDTDSTFSGSTAWNNSARSRWAMVVGSDRREVVLRHEKCNVGPKQEPMSIEFDAGAKVFRVFGTIPGAADAAAVVRNGHRAAILRLLSGAERAGQRVSMSAKANNNAFVVLREEPGFPKVDRTDFFSLLFQLQRDGLLEEVDYVNEHRKKHKCLELTEAGRLRAAQGSGAPAMWRGGGE